MEILHVSNNKVKAKVHLDEDTFICDIELDQDLQIETLCVENDIPLSSADMDANDLKKMQNEIDAFIKNQSSLIYESNDGKISIFLRVNKTKLEWSIKESETGNPSNTWMPMDNLDHLDLDKINKHFNSDF